MARRKGGLMSDGSDSDATASEGSDGGYNSQEDADSRAERRLFEQKSKRRRTGGQDGKAAAWEGIFGEGDDEPPRRGFGSRGGRGGGRGGKRTTDWTKAPTFVSKHTVQDEVETDDKGVELEVGKEEEEEEVEADAEEGGEDDDDDDDDDDDSSADESEPERRSPRVREEEEEEDQPRTAGIGGRGGLGGLGSSKRGGRVGLGAGRGGLAAAARTFTSGDNADAEGTPSASGASTPRGGLGSGHAPGPETLQPTLAFGRKPVEAPAPAPAFGRKAAIAVETPASAAGPSGASGRQSFVTRASNAGPAAPAKATQLTAEEVGAFKKMQGGIGFGLLSKFGWAPGKGLGKEEDGRAVPVAAGKILRGQGISTGVRTEDSKREARRKGELDEDSEEDRKQARARGRAKGKGKGKASQGGDGQWQPPDQGWKKARKVKVKVQHKTYEEILAEAEQTPSIGLVIDARGGEMKEVSSLSALSLSSWTPTTDNMQLPELRHNLRLIMEAAKGDVDGLAKEGRAVNERRKWAAREEQLARKRMDESSTKIARLERIKDVVADISSISAEEAMKADPSLKRLGTGFSTLIDEYKSEYSALGLDEVVVGAIAQSLRAVFATWEPFDVSSTLAASLIPWRKAFNLASDDSRALATMDSSARAAQPERVMTAWEGLLWNTWMPKVRSAINNDWDARSPHAAVHLLETWNPILPAFIRENILDQLVLPKVKEAIDAWSPRKARAAGAATGKTRSLSSIVFPWLPLLGERMEEVLEPAKRRMRSMLRSWVVADGVPEELYSWRKSIYSSSEWDKLALSHVVPKLGASLRDDFVVNPAAQETGPIEWVAAWHKLLRGSTFTHLLDVGFFPKWLDVLYIWLAAPGCKPDEVASWFTWWKTQFPEPVLDLPAVSHGFKQGLALMNEAMRLGANAPQHLRKPTFQPLPAGSKSSSGARVSRTGTPSRGAAAAPVVHAPETAEITFRSLAEDYAAQNDLVFVPLGRSDGVTGRPLFRVAKGVDGRGGVTVYVGEEAVFALVPGSEGEFRAITLEDMVKRAGA